MAIFDKASSGLPGLDNILLNLRLGDNVVFQVDSIESYCHFVDPFISQALKDNKNLVYIRFAKHPALVKPNKKIKTYKLDANLGFESFSKKIHEIVTREGKGAFYVFDCLSDLLSAWATDLMIGTGFIGGKTLGMLLARKIVGEEDRLLEPHDSFYIGSDVFYTYIVENGWWDLWLEQKTPAGFFNKAAELKSKMLEGKFPEEITEKFQQMIEYFGQSPIIVRSSSLLEDSFGNAFAGKYESLFCVNQGSPEERYQQFEDTVRQVFASTMNEDALNYRLQRGLAGQDEQMALLVQRVSGSYHKKYFLPYAAGVGFSYNTFVWDENMDPQAGMLRLVFGLGTRAVNRVEGDYPALVALDAPLKRPYAGMDNIKKYSQHEVDVLNIEKNMLETISLEQFVKEEPAVDLGWVGQRDMAAEEKLVELGLSGQAWAITFEKLLAQTDFALKMKQMFQALSSAYDYPVDVEFTLNFSADKNMQINLVQCRPLQARGVGGQVVLPKDLPKEKLVFSSKGNFMGGNVSLKLKQLVFIDSRTYGNLLIKEKYELARLLGRLNDDAPTLLVGPGRWGTRDPSLGVPVKFAEISKVKALVEIDDPDRGFSPELSFGSHFFLDLVESDIFYAALFMNNQENFFNQAWIDSQENCLPDLLPEAGKFSKNLKIIQAPLTLFSDITRQVVVCLT